MNIHISREIHNGSPLGPRYVVLIDNEYYEIGRSALKALRQGYTVEELELEPYEEEEEDYYEDRDDCDSPAALMRWYAGIAV